MLSAVSAPTGRPLAVAVDLDSTGVERSEVLSGRWHVAAARAAEQAGVDFVTFPDALALPHQLDALLLATRVAPATATIGLVPTITVTHTEPFHVSTHVATLDFVSGG